MGTTYSIICSNRFYLFSELCQFFPATVFISRRFIFGRPIIFISRQFCLSPAILFIEEFFLNSHKNKKKLHDGYLKQNETLHSC